MLFWSFTDSVFEGQISLTTEWQREKAIELGADADKYDECIVSGKFDELLSSHTMNAQEIGGKGTPYNVLLTRDGGVLKFSGAQPFDSVKIFVNRALNSLE